VLRQGRLTVHLVDTFSRYTVKPVSIPKAFFDCAIGDVTTDGSKPTTSKAIAQLKYVVYRKLRGNR
jgi:hypothetical protein